MNRDKERKSCSVCGHKSFCFTQLEKLELEYTDANRVEINYRKGEVIAKQGNFVTHILFMQKGMAKVYKEVNQTDNLILNIFTTGSLIGLPSLYGDDIMQYSVAAIEDCTICAIDKKVFEALILQNGKFASAVINTINHCTLFNFDKIISLTQKQLNGRFADTLLYLSEKVYESNPFKLTLTRKDLAEFTGVSVMSIVRVMKEFTEASIIKEKNGLLEILDIEKLEKISSTG